MLMDSEKLKKEIDDRLKFLDGRADCPFKDGYELALQQLKDYIRHEELLLEVFNARRNEA